MKHYLVEFFSSEPMENLISLFQESFDGVIFVYFSKLDEPSRHTRQKYKEFIQNNFGYAPRFAACPQRDISSVLALFSSFPKHAHYSFDITGGDEIFIASTGIFYQKCAPATMSIHQYRLPEERLLFSYPEAPASLNPFPFYTNAPQALALHHAKPLLAPAYTFGIGPLKSEILRLWRALCNCPADWNRFCSLPNVTRKSFFFTPSQKLPRAEEKSTKNVLARLERADILRNPIPQILDGKHGTSFQWNLSEDVRFLFEKAGNLLEMYAALAAWESGAFHDVRVGVTVDWNGKNEFGRLPDPRNEIDLVLMHRNRIVLASCKNNAPQNDYLYEISTMARHYGGIFAAPVLISSLAASPTVRKRAMEMGILLIDGVSKISYDALVQIWKKQFPAD